MVPFELVGAVLAETRVVQQRLVHHEGDSCQCHTYWTYWPCMLGAGPIGQLGSRVSGR